MGEEFLTLNEIAKKTGIGIRTIQKWVNEGKLKAVRPGRFWLVHQDDYEAWKKSLPTNQPKKGSEK